MTTNAHRIKGSEVLDRGALLPGYAALRMGQAKPFQWSWRHTTMLTTMVVASLTALGMNGLLP